MGNTVDASRQHKVRPHTIHLAQETDRQTARNNQPKVLLSLGGQFEGPGSMDEKEDVFSTGGVQPVTRGRYRSRGESRWRGSAVATTCEDQ